MLYARELIIAMRGGVPEHCDFCGQSQCPEDLHPEEAGQWACNECLTRWKAEESENRLMPKSFPTFGTVLTTLGFAAALALFYLGDGRNDWWMSGVFTVYTTQWGHQTFKDFKASRV